MRLRGGHKIQHENSSGNVFADIGLPAAERLLADSKKRHKFNAKKTQCSEGHLHPSAAEARRCGDLHLLQRGGAISGLEIQPTYYFQINGEVVKHAKGRRVSYTPDWRYIDNGQTVVEECKGFRTADYVLRLAFFRAFYPYLEHRETGRG